MSVVPIRKQTTDNVIHLHLVEEEKPKVRYNKDGSIDKRKLNKVAGVSSEVYPLTTQEEIKAMIDVFDKHIEEANIDDKRQTIARIAARNKMLFLIGINVGLRASDLITLKWNFFLNEDGTFKEFYTLMPKKTKKAKKFVKLYFNQVVKKAITEYIEKYPIKDMDEYLFKSKKGDKCITEIALGRIIKNTAEEAGIKKNICSHTLRKTFGFWVYHNAEDKTNALIILQSIFNHSSPAMTSKYIGLTNEEIGATFNELNLGEDFI